MESVIILQKRRPVARQRELRDIISAAEISERNDLLRLAAAALHRAEQISRRFHARVAAGATVDPSLARSKRKSA
jgi:hypothetical protein